jgi:hypothetical protein
VLAFGRCQDRSGSLHGRWELKEDRPTTFLFCEACKPLLVPCELVVIAYARTGGHARTTSVHCSMLALWFEMTSL